MIEGMNHITLAIKDIKRSFYFYRDVLALKPICLWDKGAYFLAGDFWFCLNVDENRQPNHCYTHYAFTVKKENFDTICQKVIDSGAHIFKENASPGNSLYFLDPDNHKLELHVGNWQTRLKAKQANLGTWQNVEWFL